MKINVKRIICICLTAVLLCMTGCTGNTTTTPDTADTTATTVADEQTKADDAKDPYATENETSVPDKFIEKQTNIDYGTLDEDVEYYSITAKDNKKCNVLLPAGYNKNAEYPVMYVINGWGGDYTNILHEDSYLMTLYGNMLSEQLTVPMIIVTVDMYTDLQSERETKTEEEMRLSYDKVIYDIKTDLMPFIESKYPIKQGRENTAVAGVSQGATESLAAGFVNQDVIGYIGSFAPCPGVIPTEFYKDTYWNWPVLDDFVINSTDTTPYYIYLSVGSKDPWDIDPTLYYGEVMTKNGIKNQTDFVDGYEHDYVFWRLCFYNFLMKIF